MKRIEYLLIAILFLSFFVVSCESDEDATGRTSGPDGTESLYDGVAGSTDNGGNATIPNESGVVTAGEWNDLTNWDFLKDLLQSEEYGKHFTYWGFNPTERYSVSLTNENDQPVVDAEVILLASNNSVLWKSRTDNKGTAELWANLYQYSANGAKISVNYKSQNITFDNIHNFSNGWNELKINSIVDVPKNVNVMFVVDATGSMGDEIEFLKSDLMSVMEKVKTQQANNTVQLSALFYRDHGDAYLVREFPFTTNINSIIASVNQQSADGGGDYPEAVETALEKALAQEWSSNAVSRILFILLDAPPHYEPAILNRIKIATAKAAEMGIKIIPVSASGIEKSTEMLLRSMAMATNGTYTFITDHSGVGESHLTPTVGDYQVEKLNELLVRLINKYSSY